MVKPLQTAHGYDLEADLRKRLRGPVAPAALRWVETVTGERVVSQRALEGGKSSAVHRLSLQAHSGVDRDVVLRRYVLDWVDAEPWAPGNEALALRLLGEPEVTMPAPRLLAADTDGQQTGNTDHSHVRPTRSCRVAAGRHGDLAPPPRRSSARHPRPFRVTGAERMGTVCTDTTRHTAAVEPAPRAWETAFALYDGPQPARDRVFLHRDYYPGNILWTDDHITGFVDWVSSCAGPPEEDVAHCRANLAIHHGQGQADRFLQLWQTVTGRREYDPYFDLTGIVSFNVTEPDPALDEFVATAAARIR